LNECKQCYVVASFMDYFSQDIVYGSLNYIGNTLRVYLDTTYQ